MSELPKALQDIIDKIKAEMGDRVDVEVVKMNGRTPDDQEEIESIIDAMLKGKGGHSESALADITLRLAMKGNPDADGKIVRGMVREAIDLVEKLQGGHPKIHPSLPFISLIGSSMELMYATHSEEFVDEIVSHLRATAKELARNRGTDECPCHGCQRERAAMKTQTGTQH